MTARLEQIYRNNIELLDHSHICRLVPDTETFALLKDFDQDFN